LVHQQIEACFKITGIEKSITQELTGSTPVESRKCAWKTKRLLFMTPETFRNDLNAQTCDADDVLQCSFNFRLYWLFSMRLTVRVEIMLIAILSKNWK
jgi:ERCC4-related helicase